MGRFDVLKSLARSAARSARAQLTPDQLKGELADRLRGLGVPRGALTDTELTIAVGRAQGVVSATVQIEYGALTVQLTDDAGRDLSVRLMPVGSSFAPHGAKEVSFQAEPAERAADPRTTEVVAALAGAIAAAIWGPILRLGPTGDRAHFGTFVHRDGDLLTADLRTVPAVRAIASSRLPAALLDAVVLQSIQALPGTLKLELSAYGL